MKLIKFSLTALLLLFLASCANETTPTAAEKQAALCTDLARFRTSVASLKSLSPNSTVGDLKQAQDEVKATFNQVKTSAASVQEARVAELEQAQGELDTAIQGISDTATLQQATESVAAEVAAVEAAQVQMESSLNCQ
jgi:multidrug resistance efflux pump